MREGPERRPGRQRTAASPVGGVACREARIAVIDELGSAGKPKAQPGPNLAGLSSEGWVSAALRVPFAPRRLRAMREGKS